MTSLKSKKKRKADFIRVLILLLSDLSSFYLSVIFAFYVRMGLSGYLSLLTPFTGQKLSRYTVFYGLPMVFVVILALRGFYSTRRFFWDDFKEFISTVFIFVVIIVAGLSITVDMKGWSRSVLLMIPLFLIFLFPIFRFLASRLLYILNLVENCNFIGSDEAFIKFQKAILSNKYLGFVLGTPAEYVFIDLNISDFTDKLKELTKNYRHIFLFDSNSVLPTGSFKSYFNTEAVNLVSFENKLLDEKRLIVKRVIDLVVALALVPFLIPLSFLVAILIVLDSRGPIFFTQERVGKDGKIFRLYKFRTMFVDAERRLSDILNKDPVAREEWLKNSKLKNDPRVTKIGRVLRKFSIDELPQIINILKGDMSFVGPRPITVAERDLHYRDHLDYYYSVRPGITGLAQISGRSLLGFKERIEYDKWYVENWSLWLDIVIILKTIVVVIKREGAI